MHNMHITSSMDIMHNTLASRVVCIHNTSYA